MTDRPTNQPTDRQIDWVIAKFQFQQVRRLGIEVKLTAMLGNYDRQKNRPTDRRTDGDGT